MKKFVVVLAGLVLISVGVNWWLKAQIERLDNVVQEQAAALSAAFHREQELRRSVAEILKKRRDESMQDAMLLNGKPRCTLIQRFNYEIVVITSITRKMIMFKGETALDDAMKQIELRGWVVGWSHPTIRKDRKEA